MTTREQLGRFLIGQGIYATTLLADDSYACPSERWVKDQFPGMLARFKSSISDHINLEWKAEVFDCDDFSRLAASYAALLHRATKTRAKDTALAFGEFWYQAPFGGHAINVAVVAGPDQRPKLVFFEPQDCSILNLSQEEIESCSGVRF